MTTPPPPPPEDGWPEPDAPTIAHTRETVVAPGGPPAGPPPADRRIGAGMLLALGAIALVALGILIAYLLTHRNDNKSSTTTAALTSTQGTTTSPASGTVPVPDLRGVQAPNAVSALQSVGLKARQVTVPAAGKPAGSVVSESPQQGAQVAKGSEVLLSVARGTPKPATTTTVGTTTQATTSTQATTTSTQATTTAPAPQPTSATVPDLSGLDEAGAAQALGKAGLLTSLVFVPSQDPLGTVEAQGKSPGTTVPARSHVQVNVSTGPGTKAQETVPDVIGKSLQDALSAINGAHLRLIYLKYPVTSKAQAGKVVQQTPLGNGHAPENAQVIVYLGAYRAG